MVTHQLQVERRTAKECWPETDVLPLSHADHPYNVSAEVDRILFLLYAFSLRANHRPQTNLLRRALLCAAVSIFFQLYLNLVASISFPSSFFSHVFLGLPIPLIIIIFI